MRCSCSKSCFLNSKGDIWSSLLRFQRIFTISCIAGSAPSVSATRQFDLKLLLQAAQNTPSYLAASKACCTFKMTFDGSENSGGSVRSGAPVISDNNSLKSGR